MGEKLAERAEMPQTPDTPFVGFGLGWALVRATC